MFYPLPEQRSHTPLPLSLPCVDPHTIRGTHPSWPAQAHALLAQEPSTFPFFRFASSFCRIIFVFEAGLL